ncbi:unnamed protein product [Blepharisma stoltei]|uniref:EF-hand domain-containing protein n=1 Tax=Blepharisma stoltei TaxID=1481888 RepID=A0AAU9JBS1_9CILI|nr:unnamed protein product [Blepharisma stoltei]
MKIRTIKRPHSKNSSASTADLYTLMDFMRSNPVSVVSNEASCKSARIIMRNHSEGKFCETTPNSQAANRKLLKERAKTTRISTPMLETPRVKKSDEKFRELLETLGHEPEKPGINLPLDLKQLDKFLRKEKTNGDIVENNEYFELGQPTSRRDAENIGEWLDLMLTKALEEIKDDPEKLFENTNEIYTIGLNEIIRQVSVQCKERGILLRKIWDAYQKLFENAISMMKLRLEQTKSQNSTDKINYLNKHKEELKQLEAKLKDLDLSKASLVEEISAKDENINLLKLKEQQITERYGIIQERYKALKKEILTIKEENRILKIKVENSGFQFEDDGKGGLIMRKKVRKRFIPKNDSQIETTLNKDPVLFNIKYIKPTDTTDVFVKKIEMHEKKIEYKFKVDDFQDKSTEMPQKTFSDKSINTNIEDLCGESIGVKKRRSRAMTISDTNAYSPEPIRSPLADLESFFSKIEKEEDDILVIIGKDDKDEVAEMKRKHNHIKKLINSIRENVYEELTYENMPHSKVLNLLYSSINQILKFLIKHPLEKIDDESLKEEIVEDDSPLKKKQKLIQSVINVEEESKASKTLMNDGLTIIGKIMATPVHKLKNVMFKKNVLKLIAHFYQEHAKENELNRGEHFGLYVYDLLMKKFIMKKAAENRFNNLLASCMKYKNVHKIKLFGRFLGLYDALDTEDLNFYIDCLEFLNNSLSGKANFDIEAEYQFVPYIRCVECIKHFEKLLPKNEINTVKEYLETIKLQDKVNKGGIVDCELFLEKMVSAFHSYKLEHMNFMRCIYEAADLNEDGFLQQQEFELLLRYLSVLNYSPHLAAQLFDAFSETFTSEDEAGVKAISFVNLCQMNSKHQIFTFSSMIKLSQASNQAEAEEKLKQLKPRIEEVINDIYWRFTESTVYEDHLEEMHNLIDTLRFKLSTTSNPEGTWLGYKLLEEESKRVVIMQRVRELFPQIGLYILGKELY